MSTVLARLEEILEGALVLLPGVVVGLLALAAFAAAGRTVRALTRRWYERRVRRSNLGLVLGRLAQGLALVIGVLVAATIAFPTFTPGDLLQFLGIGSLAAGFAFGSVLQNYFAGILLLLSEPFRVGDQIIHRDFEGTVEAIQTRATLIQLYDGRRVVIPNAELFTSAVTVNTAHPVRRIETTVGIGYGDDVARAKEVVLATLTELRAALEDPPPEVLALELGESSVNLVVRWWIRPPRKRDALDSRDAVVAEIKRRLLESGIDLPFPTRQVLFHDQTEETDGDRARQREGWPSAGEGRSPRSRWRALRANRRDRAARDDS